MDEQQHALMFPILGRGDNETAKISLIAPFHQHLNKITCYVRSTTGESSSRTACCRDEIVRLYQFEFDELRDGIEYHYWFESEGQVIELGGGLALSDLRFTYWKRLRAEDGVVLLSCNGVYDYKSVPTARWAMWDRLLSDVVESDQPPKMIIHGGDQYYQDVVEEKWIHRLSDEAFPTLRDDFKKESLHNALKFWSNLSYRKIAARIPSVAMLDDHDITDGAGGRPEYFKDSGFTPEWRNYAEVQIELFELLQASRNPSPVYRANNRGYSFVLDLGDVALLALDLRTEKNSTNKESPLMSQAHWAAVVSAIQQLPHKNVMILIPVVPLRNSIKVEGLSLKLAQVAAALVSAWKTERRFWQPVIAGVKYVAGLEDDLTDALGSDVNKGFFADLLRTLAARAREGVCNTFLSGDIHTGGSIESEVEVDGFKFNLPTLVSSPMGYQPMHHLVEAYLRDRSVISLETNGVTVKASNNAFTVNRNFMVVFPNRLASPKTKDHAAYIVQEGVPGAKAVALQSWVKSFIQIAINNNMTSSKVPLKSDSRLEDELNKNGGDHEL